MNLPRDSGLMRLTVVADTGAILSIAFSGLLPKFQKEFRIIIGNRIHTELKRIAKGNDDLGQAAVSALNNIEVRKTKHSHLKGEDEAAELLIEQNADLLISDDIKFVLKNKNNKKIAFSIILLGILIEQNKLSK
jgi:predicted nucleic acid-binding protein